MDTVGTLYAVSDYHVQCRASVQVATIVQFS